jgi:hypothetical protein
MTNLTIVPSPCSGDIPPAHNIERGCIPGTRDYTLAIIHDWIGDASLPKVLWLTDISGSGKSAVARQVAWDATRDEQLLCSFFFRRDIGEQSNTSSVVCNLSRQIARLGEPIASTIAKARELNEAASQVSIADSFRDLITVPLCHHPPPVPSIILIDALDESGNQAERAEFLDALACEIPLLPATVKIMLTSKPEQDIEQALDKLSTETNGAEDTDGYCRLTFDVYGGENRQDLRRFILHAFKKVAEVKTATGSILPDPWPSYSQRQGLVTHANGLFLWVKIAADYVSSASDPQDALNGLLALTSRPSPEAAMDALYNHVLKSAARSPSFQIETYYEVLGNLLVSRIPISVDHMSQVIGHDVSQTVHCLKAVLLYEPVVRITHQSFREYIQDQRKCESLFVVSRQRSPIVPPAPHPELYTGFPLVSLKPFTMFSLSDTSF